jgi:hypothetical protein
MMKFITLLFIIVTSSLFGSELMISGGASYHQSNIYGYSDIPTYRGSGYFVEADYKMEVTFDFQISVFGVYHTSSQDNTFESSSIQETTENDYLGFGLKLWFDKTYFSASMGKLDFVDIASGTTVREIRAKDSAYEFGLGHRWKLTDHFSLVFAVNALNSKLDPSSGSGFSQELEIWSYRGSAGINIVIPSFAGW